MSNENCLLALSGGGYRAMLFHTGALWRLNELGELAKLTHVSSVSGGSIVAGLLAARWSQLKFDSKCMAQNFQDQIVEPLMRLAGLTIDAPSIVSGFLPFTSASSILMLTYKRNLFGETLLGHMPSVPRFFFNATNFQTGALWTFGREVMGDPLLGTVASDKVPLACAVAASSAFPPFLAPLKMSFRNARWHPPSANRSFLRAYDDLSIRLIDLPASDMEQFRRIVVLVDGGLADNLGLVALWATEGELFIADGGGYTAPAVKVRNNWMSQLIRTVGMIHDQPSQLRAFAAISRFADHDEHRIDDASRSSRGDGAYWNMRWPPEAHTDVSFKDLNRDLIEKLGSMPTRLGAIKDAQIKQLINWGYVAANRSLPYLARLWYPKGKAIFEEKLPFAENTIYA